MGIKHKKVICRKNMEQCYDQCRHSPLFNEAYMLKENKIIKLKY